MSRALSLVMFPALLALAGCGGEALQDSGLHSPAEEPATAPATAPATVQASPSGPVATEATSERPQLLVHKTPWCGCCTAWGEQAEAAGFDVEFRDVDDLGPIKQALGVPASQASCHTAEIGGYFVEGHVPFEDVRRLLAERPDAAGIAVPGMPLGSPGMEADVQHGYRVNLVGHDGEIEEYAHYPAQ